MAAQLGRNVRQYVNKISDRLKPPFAGRPVLSARFYCDSSISPKPQLSAATPSLHSVPTPVEEISPAFHVGASTAFIVSMGCFFYWTDTFGWRTKPWKAGEAEKKMLELLERKKKESMEAYFETLDRELNTLEAKLYEREGDDLPMRIYQREIAALKKMVCERYVTNP